MTLKRKSTNRASHPGGRLRRPVNGPPPPQVPEGEPRRISHVPIHGNSIYAKVYRIAEGLAPGEETLGHTYSSEEATRRALRAMRFFVRYRNLDWKFSKRGRQVWVIRPS